MKSGLLIHNYYCFDKTYAAKIIFFHCAISSIPINTTRIVTTINVTIVKIPKAPVRILESYRNELVLSGVHQQKEQTTPT